LADAPVGGQQVLIRLRVRRFLCRTLGCARRIALRRGRVYGTVLIDIATGNPVDLLADRKAETSVTGWSSIPASRSSAETEPAQTQMAPARARPNVVQVADRWHLWHNLGEAVERAVTRHHACLREAVDEETQAAVETLVVAGPVKESRLVVRSQQRYAAVQERLAAGCSISQISRELDLERGPVYCFARAASLDELLAKTTTRETLIDGFESYLQRRWNEVIDIFKIRGSGSAGR
jgi:hypothetical protein